MSDFDNDERARSRAAILRRRATLVAYAVAAGVAMPACGGRAEGEEPGTGATGGSPSSAGAGAKGGTFSCLSTAGSGIGGNIAPCLSVFGGNGGVAGGGATGPCLSPPYGGAAGEAGAAGEGGAPPIGPCLSAPLGGQPPDDGGAGDGSGGA